ncbi:MAG: hypothetical protein ACRDMZ_14665, partial [Solirubrobacteraceae bacterium]
SAINAVIAILNTGVDAINIPLAFANKLPGIDLPVIPDIPPLAAGGVIRSGGAAIVGEQGPEVVTLPRGAIVHPNSGGMLGGGGFADVVAALDRQSAAIHRLASRATSVQINGREIALANADQLAFDAAYA